MKIVRPKLLDSGMVKFNLYLSEGCIINGFCFNPKSHSILPPRWPGGNRVMVIGNRIFWRNLRQLIDSLDPFALESPPQ